MPQPISLSRRSLLMAALACGTWPRTAAFASDQDAREVPWLDEVQRAPQRLPADAPTLSDVLVDGDGRTIRLLRDWELRRQEIRRRWLDYLGAMQLDRTPPPMETLSEDQPPGCIRRLVRYESEPGVAVEAYLLLPDPLPQRVPGVVAMHSTVKFTIRQPAGLEGDAEDFFALKLAQRGVVALAPRCFLWQDADDYQTQVRKFRVRHPHSRGMAKMLWDAMRAVDVLAALPDVDANRLGAVGHSLGGKETLYLAALDERIRVAVSSEGGIGREFSNWDAPWYLGERMAADNFPHDHHELLALVAPRAFLLLGGDSADGDRSWPYIEQALRVYALYDGPSRIGLFNHRRGHSVPPQAERRLYEWFDAYL